MKGILLILIILIASIANGQKWYAFDSSRVVNGVVYFGRMQTMKYYAKYFSDTAKDNEPGTPIKDEEALIAIAEPKLFKAYGRRNIDGERPYEIYLINGYWIISGTMHCVLCAGGTAHVVIKAKNGKVVRCWHEQ